MGVGVGVSVGVGGGRVVGSWEQPAAMVSAILGTTLSVLREGRGVGLGEGIQ